MREEARRDIRLIEPETVSEWQEDASVVANLDARDECLVCVDLGAMRQDAAAWYTQAERLGAELRAIERAMRGLQTQFQPIRKEITRVGKAYRDLCLSHAKCSLCECLVGEAHPAGVAVREPLGDALVCETCHHFLSLESLTVARSRRRDAERDEE